MVRGHSSTLGRARGGDRLIVYGDHDDRVEAGVAAARLADLIARADALPSGWPRHAALVTALVEAGCLAQGLADAGLAGIDSLLTSLARDVIASWANAGTAVPSRRPSVIIDDEARELSLRIPEGYAFYALYPEGYGIAAGAIRPPGPVRVIGIRSIGTALGAVVAAALDAPAPLNVRPAGHPFERRAEVPADALGPPGTTYVVVDEGPGLSGSSMVAVVDALEERGVDRRSIVLMPGHGNGPGARAGPRQRAVWAGIRVVPADADLVAGHLAEWLETLLGPLDEPLRDVSGGAWRPLLFSDEADWPPVDPSRERRKFLVTAGGERWLARFVGIGGYGEAKLARARSLHAAGFAPEPRGLVHGFLVERWIDAPPPSHPPLGTIAAYLAFRASAFPTAAGASLAELLVMARHNAAEVFGTRVRMDTSTAEVTRLQAEVRPVVIDGRCHRHKWLDCGGGRILKADAHDHARAHDLVGPQDIAWDVAGVAVEFGLDAAQIAWLAAAAGASPSLVAFVTPCYLAFRIGEHVLAAENLGGWPQEAGRNRAAADRYAACLERHVTLR